MTGASLELVMQYVVPILFEIQGHVLVEYGFPGNDDGFDQVPSGGLLVGVSCGCGAAPPPTHARALKPYPLATPPPTPTPAVGASAVGARG